MRFEKLNENKIRITLTSQDLIKNNIDYHSFMANPIESQDLFFYMLDKAKKEIDFDTKDYQIRIEAFQIAGNDFMLTITRSLPKMDMEIEKKRLHIKRKKIDDLTNNQIVYYFDNFDDFCSFSKTVNNSLIKLTNIAKNISLYEYQKKYYLTFTNINLTNIDLKKFFSIITEYARYISNSELFTRKLIENGNIIMKNNAIKTAIQYFIS